MRMEKLKRWLTSEEVVKYISTGMILAAGVLLTLCTFSTVKTESFSEIRLLVGTIIGGVGWLLYPMSREIKDKIIMGIAYIALVTYFLIILLAACASYLIKYIHGGNLIREIIFTVGIVLISTVTVYVYGQIIRVFFTIVSRLKIKIGELIGGENEKSDIIMIAERLTAFLVALSACIAAFMGVFTTLQSVIGVK